MIYKKEIRCKSREVCVKIEESINYMLLATINEEFEILKGIGVKSAPLGDLPIKITIKIEVDKNDL